MAFACVALLFRRERLEEILNLLPEGRRQKIRQYLTELSRLSAAELGERIKVLRRADRIEAERRCGLVGYGAPLPISFERWLHVRAWESDGRENYQVGV